MTEKLYVGDTGTAIILDCGTNISTASAMTIEVRKPDGSATTWAATLEGTTSVRYNTLAATLDQAGDWRLQAKVTIGTGVWRGETVLLTVYPAFA
jgi:hypothetical protein